MGHNLCLDIFGGPSAEEFAAGLQPHGEASIVPYELVASGDGTHPTRRHVAARRGFASSGASA